LNFLLEIEDGGELFIPDSNDDLLRLTGRVPLQIKEAPFHDNLPYLQRCTWVRYIMLLSPFP